MLEAGRYFLRKQRRSAGLPDKELIHIAVKSLGLNELYPFNPEEKIIEYAIQGKVSGKTTLTGMTLRDFIEETSSESPAPGGGSVAACLAAMGTALGTMVANLSAHKKGWDHKWEYFSDWAQKGITLQNEFIRLIEEDTIAFNRLLAAFSLPKLTIEQKAARSEAIQQSTLYAMEIPLKVMEAGLKAMDVIAEMTYEGNPDSISDAGVGALALRSGIIGAFLNVRINAVNLVNEDSKQHLLKRAASLAESATTLETRIINQINEKI
jgi:glutamate formiminotransferase/formiminotetrahydrofolate cyclodeaminase